MIKIFLSAHFCDAKGVVHLARVAIRWSQLWQPVNPNQSWHSFLFTGLLFAVACFSSAQYDWRASEGRWPLILFFMGLSVVAEILYVELPAKQGRVSVSFGTNLGAALVLAPHEAALVAAGGVFFANLLERLAVDVIIFNASQLWLTSLVTARVWRALWPAESLLPIADGELVGVMLRLALCVLVYYALNVTFVSLSMWLAYGIAPRELLQQNVLWGIPSYITVGTLGFLMAVLYLNIGVWGVLFLWVPLLLARYSFQQYVAVRAAHLETIQALALALDAKDPFTLGHSERVAEYAVEIARQMKLPPGEVEMLRYAGVLHDIGKIGISDAVLNKVGRLTDAEFRLIQSHTTIGARVVKPVGFLRGVSQVIRHHHERYDGRGYPDGLKGEEIPLAARILSVADAFDAMTYDRVYRTGMSVEDAVKELVRGKGTQFDPNIVDVFVNRVLPRKIDLTRDAAAKRLNERSGPFGDQVWRKALESDDGSPNVG